MTQLYRIIILIIFISCTGFANAKLIDRILAVVDDQVITQSNVDRIKSNLDIRRNVAPFIYQTTKYSDSEIVNMIIERSLIRAALLDIGISVNDEYVDSKIKEIEKSQRTTRDSLIEQLKQNNISFDEFFELTRDAIEYQTFQGKLIAPMISITEQDVKNYFFKNNIDNKSVSIKYDLIDFSIEKNKIGKTSLPKFKSALNDLQNHGSIPEEFKSVQTNTLGEIKEDGLDKPLANLLKKTDEGSFTEPILIDNQYHCFFIKKKDLEQSDIFLKEKEAIKDKIFNERTNELTTVWYKREENKHYIKIF